MAIGEDALGEELVEFLRTETCICPYLVSSTIQPGPWPKYLITAPEVMDMLRKFVRRLAAKDRIIVLLPPVTEKQIEEWKPDAPEAT